MVEVELNNWPLLQPFPNQHVASCTCRKTDKAVDLLMHVSNDP